jgi:hypothetical protein
MLRRIWLVCVLALTALTSLASGDLSVSSPVEGSVFEILLSAGQLESDEGDKLSADPLTSVHMHHAHDTAASIASVELIPLDRRHLICPESADTAIAWRPAGSERPPKITAG